MERELWKILSPEITAVDRQFPKGRYSHSVGRIVRVYLWAVLNDRPVDWAVRRENWRGVRPPNSLPDQSRMSRRLRQADTQEFLDRLQERLLRRDDDALVKLVDGKPLVVSRHSRDRDATFGGVGGKDRGYKLHAVYSASGAMLAWEVHPLNVDEKPVAASLVEELSGEGYLLADGNYDGAALYERAAACGHQLVAPRRRPGTGRGNRLQSLPRLRAVDLLEMPSLFGRDLYRLRRRIETPFGNLSGYGGGLICLPPWVRGLPRVQRYVGAKILLRAVRNQIIKTPAA